MPVAAATPIAKGLLSLQAPDVHTAAACRACILPYLRKVFTVFVNPSWQITPGTVMVSFTWLSGRSSRTTCRSHTSNVHNQQEHP